MALRRWLKSAHPRVDGDVVVFLAEQDLVHVWG
eukprot:CAMPEP_0204289562 /NCGR_PEP_ID=MMETSP0468-20130131/58863_1 /ASSEMBLY_ACC=CAM_ASM_000383 /TAXON_ID=2969 /ORGANISM="Oxyrrhis marina" /LENGTH=32 /DNA_ID= /DNA_START= /DNA_END= /DNA_ORIENTATION=